ncbi:MAG: hypothetical protein ABIF45_24130 [Pseudomonadota bacterium]
MKYKGSYKPFDASAVKTYPLKVRSNKVELGNLIDVAALRSAEVRCSAEPWFRNGRRGEGPDQSAGLQELAAYVVECRRSGRPVVVLSGAHPIKNGEISIIIDLIERGIVTLYSTNGAAMIHSFELALTGASSESVRDALPKGEFGMAFETGAYINCAIRIAYENGLGMGEAMGRLYCDAGFRKQVIDRAFAGHEDTGEYFKPYDGFPHAESCVFAAAHRAGIPACVHASPGTDIIDQHDSFDAAAKGATSGADFLVFAQQMCKFTEGGVIINIGTAVMGPEVVLKAVSMAANVGHAPNGIRTADFDIRPFVFDDDARDESQPYYYLRDQKSLATRIPKVFGGAGYYFQGLHRATLPPFYQYTMRELGGE